MRISVPFSFPPGAIPDGVKAVDMAAFLPLLRGDCSWPYKIKCHEPRNLGGIPKAFREQNEDMFALKKDGTAREMIRLECDLWETGAWRNSRVRIPGGWYVPESLFPRVWTPEIVGRLKALRDKVLAELADDPVARQRFLYWTWTFDAFLEDAKAIPGKAAP